MFTVLKTDVFYLFDLPDRLIALARIEPHDLMHYVKQKWWERSFCHIPDFKKKALILSPLTMILVVAFYISPFLVEEVQFYS